MSILYLKESRDLSNTIVPSIVKVFDYIVDTK